VLFRSCPTGQARLRLTASGHNARKLGAGIFPANRQTFRFNWFLAPAAIAAEWPQVILVMACASALKDESNDTIVAMV